MLRLFLAPFYIHRLLFYPTSNDLFNFALTLMLADLIESVVSERRSGLDWLIDNEADWDNPELSTQNMLSCATYF